MFGNFPGAHGLSEVVDAQGHTTTAYVRQKDRDGTTVLAKLPKTWGGVTVAGNPTVVTEAQSDGLANAPFGIENAYVANGAPTLGTLDVTRDLTRRFFENQMELNGGSNDMFAAWLDAGGLTMGHFDTSESKLYKIAQQYVLADNFFEGAFGGSFLNHQYLVCACAPVVPMDFVTTNKPTITMLGTPSSKGVPQLALNASSPASALTGPPSFAASTAVAPLDYFGTGDGYRAINTIQPAFEPSGNAPAAGATGNDLLMANPGSASTLPAQTQTTVGDQLTAANVDWAWWQVAHAIWPEADRLRSKNSWRPSSVISAGIGRRLKRSALNDRAAAVSATGAGGDVGRAVPCGADVARSRQPAAASSIQKSASRARDAILIVSPAPRASSSGSLNDSGAAPLPSTRRSGAARC
jgi:acid phosphatase